MPDQFLHLPKEDQAVLLKKHSPDLAMQSSIVEKDIWVCWVLEQLFKMPDQPKMAFKGGTSLSKVYKAIDRFSEDVDVTLDYRGFVDAVTGEESRTKLIKLSDDLKAFLLQYTKNTIKPYFEEMVSKQFGEKNCQIDLDESGEKLYVHYPSALEQEKDSYLASSVLLEFGARNITEPNEAHVVSPYITQVLRDYDFPEPNVTVLALPRTYWEKATLMHVECNRPKPRLSAERLSRHWYDLLKLSDNLEAFQSAEAVALLSNVVAHKKMFFHYGYADYDACLTGGLKLVPQEELKSALRKDFDQMREAGMFYSDPPSFDEIISRLLDIEQYLNAYIAEQKN